MRDLASAPSCFHAPIEGEEEKEFQALAHELLAVDKTPVVILPGIMGSELLEQDGEKRLVWPPLGSWSLPPHSLDVYVELIQKLKGPLDVPPCSDQQEEERVYGAFDAYKNIVDGLCDALKGPEGLENARTRPVYFYSYDWRNANDITGGQLYHFLRSLSTKDEQRY